MNSLHEQLKNEIRKYIEIDNDIKKFNNKYTMFKEGIEENIFKLMDLLDLKSYDKIKIVEEKPLIEATYDELKNKYNGDSIVDLLVVRVDIEKTIENIMIKKGYNETIARKVVSKLNDSPTLIRSLEIKK